MRRNLLYKTTLLIIAFYTVFLAFSQKVYAQVDVLIPSFPFCQNPQGVVKASYSSGTHGIPGDSANYTGSDAVYTLTDETLLQCFCAEDADGIQTNWWKVSSLSIQDIEYLESLGWVYIPDGSLWGLDNAPYVAKNNDFSCNTGGQGGHNDDDDDDDDDNDSDDDGDILEVGASTVRYGVGGILGLAATGNLGEILFSTGFGTLGLIKAYLLFKKRDA
ncbi:hypothetical protein KAZ57_00075 [Patescibacteria group bacterium]|nr:hypothetical protein [Patescibacteria group bacterium]